MTVNQRRVLIVEDTLSIGLVYENWLKKSGYDVCRVECGNDALDKLQSDRFDAVLLDLQLPDISGVEVLEFVAANQIETTIVVITSVGSIKTAVDVMRSGAFDFIVKPAAQSRLLNTVSNACEMSSTVPDHQHKTRGTKIKTYCGFIGSSQAMSSIYKMIQSVGPSSASVFITGESGTGKEVCARAIHDASPRNAKPFVALNCASIPKDLIESEIFGHLKGAFTGATGNRDGAALAANGGTLFLDEICEMDFTLQSKLLRFLQTGLVQKVGSDKLEAVDVRILCATNRDPHVEVAEQRFREDMFYRLHVVPVHMPPLRDRGEDVLEIARALLAQICADEGKSFSEFSDCAQKALLDHGWPGNVRELQNVMRNAIILNTGEEIKADMLSLNHYPASANEPSSPILKKSEIRIGIARSYDAIERDIVEATIKHCAGSIPKAAELLEVSPSTLYRKRETWAHSA